MKRIGIDVQLNIGTHRNVHKVQLGLSLDVPKRSENRRRPIDFLGILTRFNVGVVSGTVWPEFGFAVGCTGSICDQWLDSYQMVERILRTKSRECKLCRQCPQRWLPRNQVMPIP